MTQEEDAKKREENLEKAKSIVIKQDISLPPAQKVTHLTLLSLAVTALPSQIKIREGEGHRGKRVKVSGWVHNLRRQGASMMFLVLRDGTGLLQCVLTDTQCHTYDALTLSTEATVTVYGTLKEVPEGKTVSGGRIRN